MSRDDHGVFGLPACEHCDAPLEPGRITCPRCGAARSLGPSPAAPVSSPGPSPSPSDPTPRKVTHPPMAGQIDRSTGAEGGDPAAPEDGDPFGLGDPFRDPVRRRDHRPAERSRTALLVGGLIGLVLVALVAAAALWAMGQNGGTGF